MSQPSLPTGAVRAEQLYRHRQRAIYEQTDRNFVLLMTVQFLFGVLVACWLSPHTWIGDLPNTHIHIWSAVLLGGLITSLPVALAWFYPGRTGTRHVVAIGQMLMGALLIHLTGGRIETHFHVFGSLAFLAFYRDWKVLLTATLVVAVDHLLRGTLWGMSVFGEPNPHPLRWLEHVGWVLFEDLFLVISIHQVLRQTRQLAQKQSDLETSMAAVQSERDRFFDLSVDMLCVANTEGYFVRANPMFSINLGYSTEELLAEPFLEFVHPDDRQPTIEAMKKLQHGGDVMDFENRYRCSNGEYRWLSWSTRAPAPGDPLMYAVARDVTTRKEAAQALEKARQAAEDARASAEQANRAKSEFLATMSHEIRTPLNAVIGMTELVLETELNAMQRDFLQTVLESGESLLTIINEILDFSKIEAGHVRLDCRPFSVSELLGDTLRSLAVRAHAHQLELACRIAPDVPDGLSGDDTRFRQVLVNLVGNAIKFTPAGEIVVNVEVERSFGRELELRVSVRDTGIGIPDEQKQRIFEAFTQADMSSTRQFGGTGLGLSICSTLVTLMGGHIWVESESGVGSTFRFTVRMQRLPSNAAPLPVAVQPEELAGLRALVVDDHATNLRILEELLGHWKMRPHAVDNASTGFEWLRDQHRAGDPARLVISDLQMPGENGFDLVSRIRQAPDLADTPVLLLSSGFQSNELARCEELGLSQPLLKPVKRSDLLRAISVAVGDPEAAAAIETPGGEEPATEPAPALRVLLVEDGLVNQRLGQRLLEMWGHQVAVADNGRIAVERVAREDFDLILMDVRMPVMDGLEATRQIRQAERGTGHRVPIVALTAHALKADREICLRAGMDGYVSKPFRKDELLTAIQSALDVQVQEKRVES